MAETLIKLHDMQHDSMLISKFGTFFEKGDYLDVTFVCKGAKKVFASKLILSCLSPFLKTLLTEWEGSQEMVTLLLPEVDHNILKLIFDFVCNGATKLSGNEFEEFKQLLQMLEIRLPNASVIERNMQSAPSNPPPPAAKLQKKAVKSNSCTEKTAESSEIDTKENLSTAEISARRTSDPDDDPLNVPDFYFIPSTLTGQTASESSQGPSHNTGNTRQTVSGSSQGTSHSTGNKKNVWVNPDLNVDISKQSKSQANDGSPLQQGGRITRKRNQTQISPGSESRSDVAGAKRIAARNNSTHNRENGKEVSSSATIKTNHPSTSLECDSSSNVPPVMDPEKKRRWRKQGFTPIREDSLVNGIVTSPKTNQNNT